MSELSPSSDNRATGLCSVSEKLATQSPAQGARPEVARALPRGSCNIMWCTVCVGARPLSEECLHLVALWVGINTKQRLHSLGRFYCVNRMTTGYCGCSEHLGVFPHTNFTASMHRALPFAQGSGMGRSYWKKVACPLIWCFIPRDKPLVLWGTHQWCLE